MPMNQLFGSCTCGVKLKSWYPLCNDCEKKRCDEMGEVLTKALTRAKVDSTIAPGDVIVFGADHREWAVTNYEHLRNPARTHIRFTLVADDKYHVCSMPLEALYECGAWFVSRTAHPQSAEICDHQGIGKPDCPICKYKEKI